MINLTRFSAALITSFILLINTVNAAEEIAAISAGYAHTCALSTAGAVTCWGYNGGELQSWEPSRGQGQLGDGTTTDRLTPVAVVGLSSGVAAISAGYAHTCSLSVAGAVMCWGENGNGQLGDGTTTDRLTPVAVVGLSSGVAAISSGYTHTCALSTTGAVTCWGENGNGQLGDGTTTDSLTPLAVSGLSSDVAAITAGYEHTCATTTAGAAVCWGWMEFGGLSSQTPVAVPNLSSGVVAISAGYNHNCALTTAGAVKCWGINYAGQLGNGDSSSTDDDDFNVTPVPVDVSGLSSGVKAISVGYSHTCALTTAGAMKCWGINYFGQLGDGTTTNRLTPVSVYDLSSGITAISAGSIHSCAVTMAGEVKCWGSNYHGQLGDSTTTDRLTPVYIAGYGPDADLDGIGDLSDNCPLVGNVDQLNTDKDSEGNDCDTDDDNDGIPDVLDSKPTVANLKKTLIGTAKYDGWLLESTEMSKKGGKADSASTTLIVGDSAKNQAYRSILHFDTASLPNSAVITKATLKLKKQSSKGNVKPLGNLLLDLKQKNFGSSASLATSDFQATAGKTSVGIFKASGSTYSAALNATGKANISKTAATQFKLHFTKDDNNDKGDDYLKFYSGNASSSSRPSLVIEYYVP